MIKNTCTVFCIITCFSILFYSLYTALQLIFCMYQHRQPKPIIQETEVTNDALWKSNCSPVKGILAFFYNDNHNDKDNDNDNDNDNGLTVNK